MKIGILTYHFSINFGAVLQCYALQEALKGLGHSVYVIDYITKEQQDNTALYRKNTNLQNVIKNVALLPFHFKRKRRNILFESFKDHWLDCTRHVGNKQELIDLIKELGLDAIFVGSDQVWNSTIKDFDRIFFLEGIPFVKKVGYSVSLGSAKSSDLVPYKTLILEFDYFTTRERSAAIIINEVCNKKPEISLDPTYLIDISRCQSFSKVQVEKQDTVVCYFLNKKKYKENLQKVIRYAKTHNLKLALLDLRVSLSSIKAHGIINIGPQEFLNYIYSSSVVITDSFHGTVFSILLNKPFYSINNNFNGNDTRRFELLSELGLAKQYVTNSMLNENNSLPEIDYTDVNRKLESIKDYSLTQIQKICDRIS